MEKKKVQATLFGGIFKERSTPKPVRALRTKPNPRWVVVVVVGGGFSQVWSQQ
jgi:hypothetical protein